MEIWGWQYLLVHTVMSRIQAGADGRISRVQTMLLFKLCFYVKIFSLHCKVHIVMHVMCTYASTQIVRLCHGALQKIGFYLSHASIRVMLLYGSCFYTGHASIRVMLLYGSCFYTGHASIRVMLLYGSCFYTGHASIRVMLLYGSCFYTGHAFICDTTVYHDVCVCV